MGLCRPDRAAIRAAGVLLYFVVKIKNHGAKAVQKVQLRVRTLLYDNAAKQDAQAVQVTGG